uniref:Uncharacterized protein n=1 Tax=Tanacetum cinerariifolium TaxID=118510 RepID=A0A699JMM8_TANCI|nr:hypothetical protein [Tanacetum cinerariifolium]
MEGNNNPALVSLGKPAITALNNYTRTLQHAVEHFRLSEEHFLARLMSINVMNWNSLARPMRAHGRPNVNLHLVVRYQNNTRNIMVADTDRFMQVLDTIEGELQIQRGHYEMVYPRYSIEVLRTHRDSTTVCHYYWAVNVAVAVGRMELNLRRLPTGRQRQNQAMRLASQLEVELAGYQGGGLGGLGGALGGVYAAPGGVNGALDSVGGGREGPDGQRRVRRCVD